LLEEALDFPFKAAVVPLALVHFVDKSPGTVKATRDAPKEALAIQA